MRINVKTTYATTTLDTRFPGDIFALSDCLNTFYIVIEPDYKINANNGVYCVDLKSGDLYRFDREREVIPVELSAVVSF